MLNCMLMSQSILRIYFVKHFYIIQTYFLPARRYASAGNSDRNVFVCPSVRLFVCHAPELCQNEES